MKINNVEVIGNRFAYDGCHKIYVIENQKMNRNLVNVAMKSWIYHN